MIPNKKINSVMETGDHSKNEASLKSLMSKKSLKQIFSTCFTAIIVILALTNCGGNKEKTVVKENIENNGIVEKVEKYEVKNLSTVASDNSKKTGVITLDEMIAYYREKGFTVYTKADIEQLYNTKLNMEGIGAIIMGNGKIAAMLIKFASEEEFKDACAKKPQFKIYKRDLVGLIISDDNEESHIRSLFESMKK